MNKGSWPVQIDPAGCGCTECLVGMYIPIDLATGRDFDRFAAGNISEATGLSDYDFDQYCNAAK